MQGEPETSLVANQIVCSPHHSQHEVSLKLSRGNQALCSATDSKVFLGQSHPPTPKPPPPPPREPTLKSQSSPCCLPRGAGLGQVEIMVQASLGCILKMFALKKAKRLKIIWAAFFF